MDALSADPVWYSSLDPDELDELSENEAEEPGDDEEEDEEDEELDLKDRFVQPRFDAWLSRQNLPQGATRELLLELYSRLDVESYGVDYTSSVRRHRVDFQIAGMQGFYEQRSMSDPDSDTWDMSPDGKSLELVPNLHIEWVLDEETLIESHHFTGTSGSKSSSSVDETRLGERFGSNTLEQLGGINLLLQFIGTACADAGAPARYTELLPFGGLQQAILQLDERTRDSEQLSTSDGKPAQKKPKKKKAASSVSYKPPLRGPRPPDDSKPAAPRPKPKARSSSQKRTAGY
mmetsp:Transcript_90042/g.160321  ORF Transcript_90042/g.160321 Transcript_90042/m.160321 type:complete len:290 (+) Transcript_90042:76-945(+)